MESGAAACLRGRSPSSAASGPPAGSPVPAPGGESDHGKIAENAARVRRRCSRGIPFSAFAGETPDRPSGGVLQPIAVIGAIRGGRARAANKPDPWSSIRLLFEALSPQLCVSRSVFRCGYSSTRRASRRIDLLGGGFHVVSPKIGTRHPPSFLRRRRSSPEADRQSITLTPRKHPASATFVARSNMGGPSAIDLRPDLVRHDGYTPSYRSTLS
jgi:hypothetical protein